jgi:hypothetical protein
VGVPSRTLEYWRDRPASGATRATLAVREELLSQSLERTVWRLGRAIKGKIGDAKLGQAASALALLFDRWRLLRDRASGSQGMAGANGGLDLSALSVDELRAFRALVAKASGTPEIAPGEDDRAALPADWEVVPTDVAAERLTQERSGMGVPEPGVGVTTPPVSG